MGGKAKGLPLWAQIVVPIGTAFIGAIAGGLITWALDIPTTTFQQRIQKASNDMQRAQLIMEIINKSDSKYYPSLDSLIVTIEDREIKEAMTWIIQTRKNLPAQIKTEVEEKSQGAITEQAGSDVSDTTTQKEELKLDDTTCAIIYLKGDPVSESEAQALQRFLLDERKSRFQKYTLKYYPLEPRDTNWFRTNVPLAKGKNETNSIVHIYYSDSNYNKLSYRLYLAGTEGLGGVAYKEKFDGQYDYDVTNKGNGVLKKFLIQEFSPERLDKSDKKLCGYEFVIIIPPYYLNQYVLDSLYPPQE